MFKKQPLPTDLIGGKTIKTDERIDFFGEVDELSAHIMEYTHYEKDERLNMQLRKIVNILSIALAETAGGMGKVGELHLNELVELVDEYNEKATMPTKPEQPNGKCLKTHSHILLPH